MYPLLQEDEKSSTREYVVSLLWKLISGNVEGYGGKGGVRGNKKVEAILGMIRKMHTDDGYEKWLGLYRQLLDNVPKQYLS